MEADVAPDTKTRERTKDVAADRVMNGDSSSTSAASFGIKAEPAVLSWRDDALVVKGAEAPKPCLPPGEMGTLTASGGPLPAGTASTVIMIIFP